MIKKTECRPGCSDFTRKLLRKVADSTRSMMPRYHLSALNSFGFNKFDAKLSTFASIEYAITPAMQCYQFSKVMQPARLQSSTPSRRSCTLVYAKKGFGGNGSDGSKEAGQVKVSFEFNTSCPTSSHVAPKICNDFLY